MTNHHSRGCSVLGSCIVLVAGVLGATRAQALGGGVDTTDASYSFVAHLSVGDQRGCTGALVRPRWVVTAASCLEEPGTTLTVGPPPRRTTVLIGRLDRNGTGGREAVATDVVRMPGRNLALVKLDRSIDIAPVAIASTPATEGDVLRVAGFGRTGTVWSPDRLQVGNFVVQSVGPGTLTVTGQGTTNTCKGDAGGPTLRERDGRLELVAVTSSSYPGGCLDSNETRRGGTQMRVDDLADRIAALSETGRLHGSIQWPQSGRCVDALQNVSNGDKIVTFDCAEQVGEAGRANDNQRWFFVSDEGVFKHRTADRRREPLLDFPHLHPAGTQVQIWEPSGLNSQKWSLSGGVLINDGLCLEVVDPLQQGAEVRFGRCSASRNQQFAFPGDGTVRLVAAPDLCLDNAAGERKDGNRIQLWGCHTGAPQQWDLFNRGLTNVHGCLERDLSSGGGEGSRAQLNSSCVGSPNQYFEYLGAIRNAHGYCLDVGDRRGINLSSVQATTCSGGPEQNFYYHP